MTMQQLMRILKPSPTCHFMDKCSAFMAEIKRAEAEGNTHYEIASQYTRNGNPFTIDFHK